MRMGGIKGLLLGVVALVVLAVGADAQEDAATRYQSLWFQCVSHMGTLALRKNFEAQSPSVEAVAAFTAAADGLEAAVKQMMATVPPAGSDMLQVAMVPRILDVLTAARVTLTAVKDRDAPGIEAGLEWLGDAILDLNVTMQKLAQGTIRSGE